MPSFRHRRSSGFAVLPLHISFVVSIVLHLALYAIADWAGLRALPPQSPQRPTIQAMLILPEIKAPVPEARPDPPPAEPPPAPVAVAPAPTSEPRRPAAAPPAAASHPLAFYPAEAVQRGLEGDVEVGVTLDAAGNVVAARLERGSGHAILDEAALRAARTLKSLPGGGREATLPVRFRLR